MRLAAGVLVLACLVAAPVRAKDETLDGVTTGILVGTAAAAVAWDVYLAARHSRTVSSMVRDAAWEANALPYAAGVLAAHLFIPLRSERDHGAFALATVPVIAIYDVLLHGSGRPAFRHPVIPFAAGLLVGTLTWSGKF